MTTRGCLAVSTEGGVGEFVESTDEQRPVADVGEAGEVANHLGVVVGAQVGATEPG